MTHGPAALVRPATSKDLPEILDIYSHYILHTTTDMHHSPPTLAALTADFESILSLNFPYLVAVASTPPIDSTESSGHDSGIGTIYPKQEEQHQERVVGFIHAFPFRGYKAGYACTAELAIICHPDATRHGVGSVMMEAFLTALQEGKKVEQILAFMTVLEEETEDRRVKQFYEKWGFRESGKLADVGQKFGRR